MILRDWRFLAVAAVALVLLLLGYMFRYEPIAGESSGGSVLVWDRWTHEVCRIPQYQGSWSGCISVKAAKQ